MTSAEGGLSGRADRMDQARSVVVVLAFLTVLGACVGGGALLGAATHGARDACRALISRQRLTWLAWFGSGEVVRTPELRHPGVDLRHVPTLSLGDVDVAGLVAEAPLSVHDGLLLESSPSSTQGSKQ